jgi:paraquat-inducible protein B
MTESNSPPAAEEFPEPLPAREKGLSLVWLVPLIAALIAGWVGWKAWSEQGPEILITFRSADGIEAGKTRVRYRSVELGRVVHLSLGEGRHEVRVKAHMNKEAEPFLTSSTRFWVVRPRIDPGGISGLSTLISGGYIELDPGNTGNQGARVFTGLDEPPVIASGAPGRYVHLIAQQLGSLGVKSPVYYRRIQVGEVVGYRLLEDGSGVEVQLFIDAPYDVMVFDNTRFWHAGGIEATLDAEGFQLRTESVRALLAGGVGFGLPSWEEPGELADDNRIFPLHDSRASADERRFAKREKYLLHFDSSVRGLNKGAPVEFLGITIGQVHSFDLEVTTKPLSWRIPVVVEIEPKRLSSDAESSREIIAGLVEQGLRARLKTGNLLTGQLYVELEMVRDGPPGQLAIDAAHPTIPTLPGNVEELTQRLDELLARLESLPIEAIAANLEELLAEAGETISAPELDETLTLARDSMASLERLLADVEGQVDGVGGEMRGALDRLNKLLKQAKGTLANIDQKVINEDSEMQYQLATSLGEIDRAARAIRSVAESIERNPTSLIMGKQ